MLDLLATSSGIAPAIAIMTLFDRVCLTNIIQIIIQYYHASIVGKKWEPGNLVPSRFSAQIRKVEARLGKLAKIRKVETN